MPLDRKVGLDTSDIVLDGDPASLPKKATEPPQFSARVYCAKTAGSIKMPLGIEVGLDTSDIVLDGTQLPPPKMGRTTDFGPTSIVAKWLHGPTCHLVWR